LAKLGHDVICIDRDREKIARLSRGGKNVIFEEGLDELLAEVAAAGKLKFSTSLKDSLPGADMVIVAAGTSCDEASGSMDISHVEAACAEIAFALEGRLPVAIKSTVPVGTCRRLGEKTGLDIISLPEFLREGRALYDFFHPDRIIAGAASAKAEAAVRELYKPLGVAPIFMSRESSELVKFASNAFLGMKIGYINSMADLCAAIGADVRDVARGMGLDTRIGGKFLTPSPGYGGSCIPKDACGLLGMARASGVRLGLVEEAVRGNEERKLAIAKRIYEAARPLASQPCWFPRAHGGPCSCAAPMKPLDARKPAGLRGSLDRAVEASGSSPSASALSARARWRQKPEGSSIYSHQARDMAVASGAVGSEAPKIAILGLAFKGGTDDARESPACDIARELARLGATVSAFDPKAMEGAKRELGPSIAYAADAYAACEGADAVAILTEWDEFGRLDLARLASAMRGRVMADFRGTIDPSAARENGFEYMGI